MTAQTAQKRASGRKVNPCRSRAAVTELTLNTSDGCLDSIKYRALTKHVTIAVEVMAIRPSIGLLVFYVVSWHGRRK